MEAYAVVETGGKQYRVKSDDTLRVERIDAEVGSKVELASVLATERQVTALVLALSSA